MAAPVSAGDMLAGKYRVERVLGEGGMGIVVAAVDTQLERKVAIKFLLPQYAEHKEASQRFLREARAAVKIHSEHVARVIDVAMMDGGIPYMVMEYLEGADLAAVLEERKQLPVDEAVAHVVEACDAIAEAHSAGIVHRDLKPANLFLTRQPDGSSKIKVLDFGISKAMMSSGSIDPSLTRTSSLMGSPLYMSPEQMKSAKNVDPRTDIWALGAILYELLSGEPPFYAESIPELSAKVLLEEVVPIRQRRRDVPEALDAAVKRALAKDPAARFPNVAAFAAALLPFAPPRCRTNVERAHRVLQLSGDGPSAQFADAAPGNSPAYARTAAAWTESSEQRPGPPPKRRAPIAFAAAAVAAFVAFGVFIFGGKGSDSSATRPVVSTVAPAPEPTPGTPSTAAPPSAPNPAVAPAAAVAPASAAPVPSESANAPAASAASANAPNVAQPAPLPGALRPRVAARPKPSAKPASAPEPAPPSDPFGGFGSRK